MKRAMIIGIFLMISGSLAIAQSSGTVNRITVITVQAANNESFIDPRLYDLSKELQSVFRYSSYRLLSQSTMQLTVGQTGSASLPGHRNLNITFIKIEGNRAQLKLEISKDGQRVFETVIQLLNGGTITVGGPQHEGGFLLFNITNSF